LSFWPPGYPAAIAVPVSAGTNAIQGGRIVNVVAAAITAFTVVMLVGSMAGTGAGVTAAVMIFATPAVFDVHLSILSEPLFIACLVLTLAAMVYARDRLLVLGLVSAMTVMVRYAGACAPAAVTLWTLVDARYAGRRRFLRAIVVALLPVIALVAWVTRTALAKDRHGTPELAVYGGFGATLAQGGTTLVQWLAPLVPEGIAQTVTALALALALLAIILATMQETASTRFRQRQGERVALLLRAAWLLVACYVVVVFASRLFVGRSIPFDWRILSPMIVLLELIIVVSVAHWWRGYHRPVHVAVAVVALLWIGASASVAANDGYYAATEGSDFANVEWRESPVLAWVRQYGRGHTLYSNWPPAVYFHTGRIARETPDWDEVKTDLPNFSEALRTTNGVIVGFNERSPDVVAPDSVARLLQLRVIARFRDGTIWAP
jgi:4-amino-4-deoxy-L-arabinose transferase-like glycosyltransferase